MVSVLRYDQALTRDDGDKWLTSTALFTAPAVLIEYSPLPETWDFLGRIFRLVEVDAEWVIADAARIWPNRKTLVSWPNVTAPYLCEMRLVKYLKPGRLKLWEVS